MASAPYLQGRTRFFEIILGDMNMEESITGNKTFFYGGTEVARMTCDRRILPEEGRISVFYNAVVKALESWFDKVFAASAVEEYKLSEDDRKKWRYLPHILEVNLRKEENGRNAAIIVTLIHRQGTKRIAQASRRTVWDEKQKMILSSGYLKSSKRSKKRFRR